MIGSRSLRSLVRDDEIDTIFKQPIPVILRSIAKAMRLEGRRPGPLILRGSLRSRLRMTV
jgi:hypothetical protein